MANFVDILPDNKGGQLKFRAEVIRVAPPNSGEVSTGEIVDIFINNGELLGTLRNEDIKIYNRYNLQLGRPKGYGIILWHEHSSNFNILWTPFIGDEGFFDE